MINRKNRIFGSMVIAAFMSINLFIGCSKDDTSINHGKEVGTDTLEENESAFEKLQEPISKKVFALGTYIDLKIFDGYKDKAEEALEKAVQRIEKIEKEVSVNIEESEISKVNAKAGKEAEKVGEDAYIITKKALEYGILTDGVFDVSIRPVAKLWGIGTENARVPSKKEINENLLKVDFTNIDINDDDRTIFLKNEGDGIDLGGIAKGYIADEIKKIFKEYEINSAIINLGGNVMTVGSKVDGSLWRVGIQNPIEPRGDYLGVLAVKDKTVVTSGNYERYFEKDGVRYHHIIDPKTGYPAKSGLLSTTIIASKSIDADALSTSVYILGLEEGMKLIDGLKGIEAIFITDTKEIYVTDGVKDDFNLLDNEFSIKNN